MSVQAGLKGVTVTGNLTSDPEIKYTPSGQAVANFTIAVNARYQDRASQEWRDGEPAFIRCSAWRNLAENIAESLRKGMKVIAQGDFKPRGYDDKDTGKRITVWEMTVSEIGPALSYATVRGVEKASRSNGSAPDDAWQAPVPAGAASGSYTEPDF